MMWTRWKTISSPRLAESAEHWLDLPSGRVKLVITHRPQARRMTLRLAKRGGGVALTLPKQVAVTKGLDWVRSKAGWIETQFAKQPPASAIGPGMVVTVAGKENRLDWSPTYPRTPKCIGDTIRIGGPLDLLEMRLIRWLKAEARRVLTDETARFAAKARVKVIAVSIGDPVSRWGSCSASGAIRYSWRLILAPYDVMEATVAHEVAHRVHMNHSAAFHGLVNELLERDANPSSRWLKQHGSTLHGFGTGS